MHICIVKFETVNCTLVELKQFKKSGLNCTIMDFLN